MPPAEQHQVVQRGPATVRPVPHVVRIAAPHPAAREPALPRSRHSSTRLSDAGTARRAPLTVTVRTSAACRMTTRVPSHASRRDVSAKRAAPRPPPTGRSPRPPQHALVHVHHHLVAVRRRRRIRPRTPPAPPAPPTAVLARSGVRRHLRQRVRPPLHRQVLSASCSARAASPSPAPARRRQRLLQQRPHLRRQPPAQHVAAVVVLPQCHRARLVQPPSAPPPPAGPPAPRPHHPLTCDAVPCCAATAARPRSPASPRA